MSGRRREDSAGGRHTAPFSGLFAWWPTARDQVLNGISFSVPRFRGLVGLVGLVALVGHFGLVVLGGPARGGLEVGA